MKFLVWSCQICTNVCFRKIVGVFPPNHHILIGIFPFHHPFRGTPVMTPKLPRCCNPQKSSRFKNTPRTQGTEKNAKKPEKNTKVYHKISKWIILLGDFFHNIWDIFGIYIYILYKYVSTRTVLSCQSWPFFLRAASILSRTACPLAIWASSNCSD